MNKSKEKIRIKNEKTFIAKVAIVFVVALCLLHFNNILIFLGKVLGIVFPFFVGIAIAYIWNLILNFLEKYLFPNSQKEIANKIRRPLSMTLSFLVIIGIIAGVMYIVIPQIYESTRIIVEAVPTFAENTKAWFLRTTEGAEWANNLRNNIENLTIDWQQVGSKVINFLRNGLGGFLGSTLGFLGNVAGFFITFFTAIIFAIYLLIGKEKLATQTKKITNVYLSKKFNNKFYHVMDVLDDTFSSYIKGQCLSAFSLSALITISMLIVRIPYAFTIGVVTMITAFIPIVGAFLGGAVGFFMIAAVNFEQAIIFLIIIVVCQQIEGNIIYPQIVGDSIGLPGIWTFVAVVFGGSLFGTMGMILAVPIFATFYKLFKERTDRIIAIQAKKEERKELKKAKKKAINREEKRLRKKQLKQEKIVKQKLQNKNSSTTDATENN